MNRRAWLTLSVSTVAGALVWALSPWLVGRREPWDAEGHFYVVALLIAGCLAGFLAPRPLWAHYIGALVGQLGYELVFLSIGPLLPLGVACLLAYSIVFVAAAAAGAYLRVHCTGPPIS